MVVKRTIDLDMMFEDSYITSYYIVQIFRILYELDATIDN